MALFLVCRGHFFESNRGSNLILVQRRAIALVLVDLLRTLDDRIGFLRPQAVVGSGHYNNDSTHYVEWFSVLSDRLSNLELAKNLPRFRNGGMQFNYCH